MAKISKQMEILIKKRKTPRLADFYNASAWARLLKEEFPKENKFLRPEAIRKHVGVVLKLLQAPAHVTDKLFGPLPRTEKGRGTTDWK